MKARDYILEHIPTLVKDEHVAGMKMTTLISILNGYHDSEVSILINKIKQKYEELRLKNISLNNKMDNLDCIKDRFYYGEIASEQELVQQKELILAWVLGYAKEL